MWGIPLNVPQFDDFEEMFLGIQDPRIPGSQFFARLINQYVGFHLKLKKEESSLFCVLYILIHL